MLGIDWRLVVVVIGDGKLLTPLAFALRRPDPKGPGRRGRDKMTWTQTMLDARLAVFATRGLTFPPLIVVADRWFSDSTLMRSIARAHRCPLLVQGKRSYSFTLEDGHKVKGLDWLTPDK